jgi:GT2 family glycosyltransferase
MTTAISPATIVIPQRGLSGLTLDCIRSFRRHHGDACRIVIVDDGSPPADVQAIAAQRLKNVDLVCRPPEGVTAAWNAGARGLDTPVIVFLNNDATTLAPWLDDLVAPLVHRTAVVSGAELRNERTVPAAILRRLPTRRFAAGWCFAVRRDDFEAVGGFNSTLETYFSDTDLQSRLLQHHDSDERGIAIPIGGRLRHAGHATARRDPNRASHWRADRARFISLWHPSRVPQASACEDMRNVAPGACTG